MAHPPPQGAARAGRWGPVVAPADDEVGQGHEAEVSSTLRVARLNGEVLEVALTREEAARLVHNRDLKLCLARHDATRIRSSLAVHIGKMVLIAFDISPRPCLPVLSPVHPPTFPPTCDGHVGF